MELRFVSCAAIALAAAATATKDASASFISAVVVAPTTQTAGRWVWSVYLKFGDVGDRLVSVSGFQLLSGTMAGVQHRDYGSGTWNPAWNLQDSPSWSGSDSWVSIDGQYLSSTENTVLGWPGGGSTIPNGASWSQQVASSGGATQYNDPLVTGSAEIKIMQIAGTTLAPGQHVFSIGLNVDWRESTNSPIQSSAVQVAIPGPGGVAMGMVFALASGRRRRRA